MTWYDFVYSTFSSFFICCYFISAKGLDFYCVLVDLTNELFFVEDYIYVGICDIWSPSYLLSFVTEGTPIGKLKVFGRLSYFIRTYKLACFIYGD